MVQSDKKKIPQIRMTPYFVIFAFIILWGIGISCGEPGRVLEQAVQVCLSCIGIG